MRKFFMAIVNFFTIACPQCARRLDRNHSEDIWLADMHHCYRCGHEFIEGGDGLE